MQYRRPWEIEACFRINRYNLRIRPVFHRVKRRVRAHIAIRYMALSYVGQMLRKALTEATNSIGFSAWSQCPVP